MGDSKTDIWVVNHRSNFEVALLYEGLLAAKHPVGLDCETVGCNPKVESPVGKAKIVCWSLSMHPADGHPRVFLWGDSLHQRLLNHWLQDPDRPKVGHNIFSYDYHCFANHGIQLNGIVGDTLRMHKLLYTKQGVKHGLKPLSKAWFGFEQPAYTDLFSRPRQLACRSVAKSKQTRRKHEGSFIPHWVESGVHHTFSWKQRELIPLDRIEDDYPQRLDALYEYATADAMLTRRLYEALLPKMKEQKIDVLV